MKNYNLPKSELEVLSIVWKLDKANVREVFEELSKEKKVDYWTVQTYLRRLEKKGILRANKIKGKNYYSAKAKQGKVIENKIEGLLGLLFDGQPVGMMQYLIANKDLSNEELDELQALIDKHKNSKE